MFNDLINISGDNEGYFCDFLIYELTNFSCNKCNIKFGKPIGTYDANKILSLLHNLICDRCEKCYHCCKKLHKCK